MPGKNLDLRSDQFLPSPCQIVFPCGSMVYSLDQCYSTFFVRVLPDVVSLQLCTLPPTLVCVYFKLYSL
jgi:hypothetical protein